LLERALENLLENAGKYAPGEVMVTLTSSESRVSIRVQDRGPGLRGEALHRASEAFYRAPGTRGPGSGLGLAVVSRIMGAHGGTLRLENRDGGGLCVILAWSTREHEPLWANERAFSPGPNHSSAGGELNRKHLQDT